MCEQCKNTSILVGTSPCMFVCVFLCLCVTYRALSVCMGSYQKGALCVLLKCRPIENCCNAEFSMWCLNMTKGITAGFSFFKGTKKHGHTLTDGILLIGYMRQGPLPCCVLIFAVLAKLWWCLGGYYIAVSALRQCLREQELRIHSGEDTRVNCYRNK